MKIFSVLSPRNIEIHSEAQSGTAFFHSIREFDYERGGAYDVSNNGAAHIQYISW